MRNDIQQYLDKYSYILDKKYKLEESKSTFIAIKIDYNITSTKDEYLVLLRNLDRPDAPPVTMEVNQFLALSKEVQNE